MMKPFARTKNIMRWLLVKELLIVVLLHRVHLGSTEHLFLRYSSFNFCSQTVARKSCPTPSTYDSILIQQYLGKWFEIGSTAQFKFQSETGRICDQANYSLVARSNPSEGSNIAVLNSALPVIGQSAIVAIRGLSSAARSVCSNARKMCTLIESSSLKGAIDKIFKASIKLSTLYPEKASALSQAGKNISSSLERIESGLDLLASRVAEIQFVNGRLSQALGKVEDNVQTLNQSLQLAMSEQSAVMELVVSVGVARSQIEEIANSVKQDTPAATKLLQAALLIEEVVQNFDTRLLSIELELLGIQAAAMSVLDNHSIPSGKSSFVLGDAIQDVNSAGKLMVTIRNTSGPYWIIALEGEATEGYSAALIYSCQEEEEGQMREDLFILSRARDLSKDTIDRFFWLARANDILTDCENPFIYTKQREGDCGEPDLQSD